MENNRKGARTSAASGKDNKGSGSALDVGGERLIIVAGPCMLESRELGMQVAERLRNECDRRGFGYVFKASFDKANRTSIAGKRGPGLELGLKWLAEIKGRMEVPILTDIHEPYQATPAAEVADILQIPAFLCRQTDLLVSAAATGRPLNVKKAQFLAPEDMGPVVEKCRAAGASEVILCERGTMLGYHQLVVDFSSLAVMRSFGCPVMFDATHSVQMPGGLGNATGGDRRRILSLIRAALAVGVDSLFMEIHPDPDHAQSDGPNMIPLDKVGGLFDQIERLDEVIRRDLGFAGLDWLDRM